MKINKYRASYQDSPSNVFLFVCSIGISLGILIEIINLSDEEKCVETPKYWMHSGQYDVENERGVLKHVHKILGRVGYKKSWRQAPWDLLWAIDFPPKLYKLILKLEPHQKVNHFPGTEVITNKVLLARTKSKYIPITFELPKSKIEFQKFVMTKENSLFLEKNPLHKGVSLKTVYEILLFTSQGESFVQEFIQNPFLVEGHKFDFGVYVVLTSVNPLRAYWYKGDVMFRYCLAKYYPLDRYDLDKYVIDGYLPTWKMPSLAHSFSTFGFGMKDSFDIYATSKGKDPRRMWDEVQKAISEILVLNEQRIIDKTKRYSSLDNFFEMMRFDLVVDKDLKVYVLEANMSPNLNPGPYRRNAVLFDQVLYNLFLLTEISRTSKAYRGEPETKDMISSQKHIAVFSNQCVTICKDDCTALELCKLCKPCLDAKLKKTLLQAHTEFLHRGDFRRLVPPPMTPQDENRAPNVTVVNLSSNWLLHMWYQGKCNLDIAWCT